MSNTTCNTCGRSVALGSGRFTNRIPDGSSPAARREMGRLFPEGDYVCAECNTLGGTVHRIGDCLINAVELADRLAEALHGETWELAVRLQVHDGTWKLHFDDPCYDTDHRGYWGATIIDHDSDPLEAANDLIEQCYEETPE